MGGGDDIGEGPDLKKEGFLGCYIEAAEFVADCIEETLLGFGMKSISWTIGDLRISDRLSP